METNSQINPYYCDISVYNGESEFISELGKLPPAEEFIYTALTSNVFFVIFLIIEKGEIDRYTILFWGLINLFPLFKGLRKQKAMEKIEVKEDGIHRKFGSDMEIAILSWDEIDYIKIVPHYNATKYSAIYIRAKENQNAKYPKLVFPYNSKAVHCIMKYWDKEIAGLSSMSKWAKYAAKL